MCTEVFVRDDEKVLGIVVMVSEHWNVLNATKLYTYK